MKTAGISLILALITAVAGADERIDRAQSFAAKTNRPVLRERIEPQWAADGKSFWYRVQTEPSTYQFVVIDAATGERKTADAREKLDLPAVELRSSQLPLIKRNSERNGPSTSLKFVNKLPGEVELFWVNQEGQEVSYGKLEAGAERSQHTYQGHVWLIKDRDQQPLATVEGQADERTVVIDGKGLSEPQGRGRRPGREGLSRGGLSPDGKWRASIEDGLIKLRNQTTNETRHLKTDRDEDSPYRGRIAWAPDSSAFVVYSAKEVTQRRVTIVESSPKDQSQPKLKEFDYTKPGDPLPQPVPVIFRLKEDGYDWQALDNTLFATPFTQAYHFEIRWADDSREFYFDYNQRGHQTYRILAANALSGEVRTVVEETSPTFIDYTQKTYRHWLPATGELLWMSERNGWCHLYLYDVASGTLKNAVTSGDWVVRNVLHVDEDARQVWFMAACLQAEQSPYHQHLCRANFDGSGFVQLTQADGNHRVEFSPTREFFVATWSRADHPPVHELRKSDDGRLISVLEKADAAPLLDTGWSLPERFVAKGRDGKTDIHGVLIKPSYFDPSKRYPVVEEIYAGPHSAFAPTQFGKLQRQHAIAELGFIVVQIDGMGTNHRGKAFHDVCWKNLKDAGYPDRIAWIKAAAESRPWMDLSRVGIYGGSAGGQNAMRALLDYHDFYKVAVADCGCHDNRMDKIWWNEQWMGWPIDDSYAKSSNVDDAHKLQGKLLLIVGELDTNVDPASTTQVVSALQKANKSFDYMPIAGAGHGAAETPYGSRLRMEFLVRHLQP